MAHKKLSLRLTELSVFTAPYTHSAYMKALAS